MPNFVHELTTARPGATEEPGRGWRSLSPHFPQTLLPKDNGKLRFLLRISFQLVELEEDKVAGSLGNNPCAESIISCDARGAASAIWTAPADAAETGPCACCYLWHPETAFPFRSAINNSSDNWNAKGKGASLLWGTSNTALFKSCCLGTWQKLSCRKCMTWWQAALHLTLCNPDTTWKLNCHFHCLFTQKAVIKTLQLN